MLQMDRQMDMFQGVFAALKQWQFVSRIIFADVTVEYPPLQVVFIFFDTSTYDEIERDVKVSWLGSNIELWVVATRDQT